LTSSFADLGVPTDLARALRDAGIDTPFPIQEQTVPAAIAGRDLCGRAPTGSGKTLAFALPVAALAQRAKPHRPTALILTPTRELAAQIRRTLLPLARVRDLRVATIYGGTNIKQDITALRKGFDIAVATPGRLADLVQRGDISLGSVALVVLDEADRMADMGFLPEVKRLLDRTPDDRQTLLFSATLDGDVDVLVRRYQVDPVTVEIDDPVEEAGDVRHLFWATERSDRRSLTADIVRQVEPAIVFTRTKRGADRLAKQLNADGIRAAAIHGDRSQRQRERALEDFQRGRSTTLVATDVAARGIHVDDVAVVVHFDPPSTDKDYVHRSGRTGRAGATGLVVSLVTPDVRDDVDALQRSLELPRGLHARDLGHLTSDVTPATAQPTRAAADRSAERTSERSSSPRSRPARGKGGSRKRAPHGKGGSRQRSSSQR
jgi:superfamily II DNA/RNA helicase